MSRLEKPLDHEILYATGDLLLRAEVDLHLKDKRALVSGSTAGADTSSLREIAELLDADWLPSTALTASAT